MITNKKWQELLMLANTGQPAPKGATVEELDAYKGLVQDVKYKPKGAFLEIPMEVDF